MMLAKSLLYVLIFIVLAILHLGETKAFSYLDEDFFGNRIDRNWSYEMPNIEEMAAFWVKSNLNGRKVLDEDYSEEGEILENESLDGFTQVLTDSYEIGKNSLLKVYCVISNGERNCMEFGVKKNTDSPVKIRIRSNPKIIKKKIDSDENQSSSAQEFGLSLEGKSSFNFSENIKQSYSTDMPVSYGLGESGLFNKFRSNLEDRRQQHQIRDSRRKKRDSSDEIVNYDYTDDEEEGGKELEKNPKRYYYKDEKDEENNQNAKLSRNYYEFNDRNNDNYESYNNDEKEDDKGLQKKSNRYYYKVEEDEENNQKGKLSRKYNEFKDRNIGDYQSNNYEYDNYELGGGENEFYEPQVHEYNDPENSNPSKLVELAKSEGTKYNWNQCRLPKKAKNAEILCTKWPSAIACNLYCAYGFRFEEGISRTTSCKNNEGVWTKKFSECQPFMDCTIRQKSAGKLFCTTNHLNRGAECEIECEKSGSNDKVPKMKYICAAEGRWGPQLPHCVESEGLDVLQPPDVTAHKGLYYPSKYPK